MHTYSKSICVPTKSSSRETLAFGSGWKNVGWVSARCGTSVLVAPMPRSPKPGLSSADGGARVPLLPSGEDLLTAADLQVCWGTIPGHRPPAARVAASCPERGLWFREPSGAVRSFHGVHTCPGVMLSAQEQNVPLHARARTAGLAWRAQLWREGCAGLGGAQTWLLSTLCSVDT